MNLTRKSMLTLGTMASLAAVSVAAQDPRPPARPQAAAPADTDTVVVGGQIEWIQRAAIAARREGVLDSIELDIGKEARAGDQIAKLKSDMAEKTVAKAKIQAAAKGPIQTADAKRELAVANMVRAERLLKAAGPGQRFISEQEYQTAEAELLVAQAGLVDAQENQALAKAELDLAEQALEEHIVRAPFDGEVFEVLKKTGEAVQANEAVVQLVQTDKLRFYGYVPLEIGYRLQKGMVVDVTPIIEGSDLPVEKKRFRGRLVFVSPELAAAKNKAEVQIKADIVNNTGKELRSGLRVDMTIYLTDDPSQIPPAPADMLPMPDDAAPRLSQQPVAEPAR